MSKSKVFKYQMKKIWKDYLRTNKTMFLYQAGIQNKNYDLNDIENNNN